MIWLMYGTILKRFSEVGLPQKSIVLTFDDGPVGSGLTAQLLDLLAGLDVSAAFCLVGKRTLGNEGLVQKLHEAGHLIVNHGYLHRIHNLMSDADFLADLQQFDASVASALNCPAWTSAWFRPPGGGWDRRLVRLLAGSGKNLMPITFFGWDTLSYPFQSRLTLRGMLSSMRKNQGGVFLLHEDTLSLTNKPKKNEDHQNRQWILPVVEAFVKTAREEGYRFVDPQVIGKS